MPRKRLPRPNCLSCGSPVDRPVKRYCTNRCQQEFTFRRFIETWKRGLVSGLTGGVAVSPHIRRYLLEVHGCCVRCGWAEVNPHTGKIPLHVDHVDGNYVDGNYANNRPENLRLLCPNCHALTATYGSRNRGHGRPFYVVKKLPPVSSGHTTA